MIRLKRNDCQSEAFNRYKSLISLIKGGALPTELANEFQRWLKAVEPKSITLGTPRGQLDEWKRDRRLAERWYEEYRRVEKGSHAGCPGKGIFLQPQIDELKRTRAQGEVHFNEWYAAIQFYKEGYQVLVEKYPCAKYGSFERAEYALQQYDGLWTFLKSCWFKWGQPPDLLLYKKAAGKTLVEALFVECKGLRRGRPEPFTGKKDGKQLVMFPFIVKEWSIPFKIAWVVVTRD